ncbi:MAG: exodeoxyribonuclease III [Thermoplasmata archaeon]|jgi:exodeoxyribonuclease-3|nr:exodeoxyribonuclease III [Thermoplasmata archaeon]
MLSVATWNVNSLNARLPLVERLIEELEPDVLALQEIKMENEKFPVNFFRERGYESVFKGEKGYNGVAIVSKFEITSSDENFEKVEGKQKRILLAEIEGLKIINAYFPHGKMIGSPSFEYKIGFIEGLRGYITENFGKKENLLLVGDFNVAPEEKDVYAPEIMQYSIGFSREERDAISRLKNAGFVDIFRLHNKKEGEYTWWDYRSNSFKRNAGMRVDHIWGFSGVAERSRGCFIYKRMREMPRPSDHAPVIALFEI